MYQNKTALLFIVTAFVTGMCGAFFYPLSSLFIVEALGASPAMLSAYMVLAVCSSVVVSQFIAAYSDRGWQRKRILLLSLGSYLVTVISFTFIRNYYLAVGIAMIFGSISGAIFGQLFALGREYGDKHLSDSTSFLSAMRAGIAIAWVFGPPLAFMLKGSFGFSASFLTSAVMVAVTMLIVARYLPGSDGIRKDDAQPEEAVKGKLGGRVVLYCVMLVFTFGANNLYITSMPLYLSQELMIKANWLGILFGVAALCEIPIMMNAGRMANRFGTERMLIVGLICGSLFFFSMLNVTEFWAMIAVQVFNGVFIGISATLGMVVLQDMMADRLGVASTLFSNMLQLSMLVASLSVGFVGELYNYYSAFYLCLSGALVALVLMVYFSLAGNGRQEERVAEQG